MATFYGKVKGKAGEATRLGTKKSGLKTVAASWKGAVAVTLMECDNGDTKYIVELMPWHGVGECRTLAMGTFADD